MLSLYTNTKEDVMFAYNLWQWIAFFIIYCLIGSLCTTFPVPSTTGI